MLLLMLIIFPFRMSSQLSDSSESELDVTPDERLLDGEDSREEGEMSSDEEQEGPPGHHDPHGGKERAVTASTSSASGLPRYYHSIRAAKLAQMSVRTLGGCADTVFVGIGSMANDPRFSQANTRFSYQKKKNISTSFDIGTLKCNTCVKGSTLSCTGIGRPHAISQCAL
jgi:hypothetical protein